MRGLPRLVARKQAEWEGVVVEPGGYPGVRIRILGRSPLSGAGGMTTLVGRELGKRHSTWTFNFFPEAGLPTGTRVVDCPQGRRRTGTIRNLGGR